MNIPGERRQITPEGFRLKQIEHSIYVSLIQGRRECRQPLVDNVLVLREIHRESPGCFAASETAERLAGQRQVFAAPPKLGRLRYRTISVSEKMVAFVAGRTSSW
jgi:hypothetical protein